MDDSMDSHFFDLINREIDGDASSAESDELRQRRLRPGSSAVCFGTTASGYGVEIMEVR